ncbi:Arabinose 5-phosphate isomerase KdsD [Emticicia aquatica]|uniref:Arabinose 5-phosphate isomerase KdsD n=1 Tax=Emticicia aquatica TaxID=1681835 RepID=A0ABN8EWP8_9BACT|nr:KpsF/GutQ family sugar-phosphate isomerase [Emticicia aquatica]CAH0996005.1 Arabinose 5-phosphate isomerase KdsD [Emticicia aquatica]
MNTKLEKKIQSVAKKVLQDEAEAILSLKSYIDEHFESCVNAILNSKGRLIITGIGKSAIIGQKIVATMNSTGTPAIFMHAADAIHGDLGMIQDDDIVLCISKSGDTPEIKVLVPLLKRFGNQLIAMVSNVSSYLAKNSDYILNAHVEREACPLNLAPTTSTTAALALGDALAMCLLEVRDFSSRDFAKYHPGGSLGKKLYLKVRDIFPHNAVPKVLENADIQTVILEMTSKRLGATSVVNEKNELMGIITDGDLRRMLNNQKDFSTLQAKDIMNATPKVISPEEYAANALAIMQRQSITQLVVMEDKVALGFVHLHDLLKEGLA